MLVRVALLGSLACLHSTLAPGASIQDESCLGSGVFSPSTTVPIGVEPGIDALTVESADLDADGREDLVVFMGDPSAIDEEVRLTTLFVFFGLGDGVFDEPIVYPLEAPVRGTEIVDLNQDGFPDVLTISEPGLNPESVGYADGILYFENDGAGGLLPPQTLTQGPERDPFVKSFEVFDSDGDGRLDILYVSISEYKLLLGLEEGGFGQQSILHDAFDDVYAMRSADWDADGDTDVIAGRVSGGLLFENDGSGLFSVGPMYGTGFDGGVSSRIKKMIVVDLNGDARVDILQLHEEPDNGGVSIFLNVGTGDFDLSQRLDLGLGSKSLLADAAMGDVDNDGDQDCVVISQDVAFQSVLLRNAGDGTFVPEQIKGAGDASPVGRGVTLMDANLDGALDVVGDLILPDAAGLFLNGCRVFCLADLIEPYGVLDASDVMTFLGAFGKMSPDADLAEPFGVIDFDDVLAFLVSFGAGCP